MSGKRPKPTPKGETPPKLTATDEIVLDHIWDKIRKEQK